jgi:hypothetical protein
MAAVARRKNRLPADCAPLFGNDWFSILEAQHGPN